MQASLWLEMAGANCKVEKGHWRLWVFQDMIFGGAWPLVVRGLTCLALIQLTSEIIANYILCSGLRVTVLIGTPCDFSRRKRVAITGP